MAVDHDAGEAITKLEALSLSSVGLALQARQARGASDAALLAEEADWELLSVKMGDASIKDQVGSNISGKSRCAESTIFCPLVLS